MLRRLPSLRAPSEMVPALRLAEGGARLGGLDAVGHGVAHELQAGLDELLGDAPVDGLVGAARAHDDRAPAAPRLGLDGRREPREDAAHGRLAHRRELLLRVGHVVAQRVLGRVRPQRTRASRPSPKTPRRAATRSMRRERRGGGAPGTGRADEAQRLDEGRSAGRAGRGPSRARRSARGGDGLRGRGRSRRTARAGGPRRAAATRMVAAASSNDRRARRARTPAGAPRGCSAASRAGAATAVRARAAWRGAVSGSSSSAPSTTRQRATSCTRRPRGVGRVRAFRRSSRPWQNQLIGSSPTALAAPFIVCTCR